MTEVAGHKCLVRCEYFHHVCGLNIVPCPFLVLCLVWLVWLTLCVLNVRSLSMFLCGSRQWSDHHRADYSNLPTTTQHRCSSVSKTKSKPWQIIQLNCSQLWFGSQCYGKAKLQHVKPVMSVVVTFLYTRHILAFVNWKNIWFIQKCIFKEYWMAVCYLFFMAV